MTYFAIEILGSGGAVRTPRPGCTCERCTQARRLGLPWARCGPSVFVHGPDVLIDTPEEICIQLDRSRVRNIAAGLYSHWHPDHTNGRRVWETRNADFLHWPPQSICTPIYLPPRVAADFAKMDILAAFHYMQKMGYVEVRVMDQPFELNGWRVSALPLHESYVYAYLFEEIDGARRVLVAMDELFGWSPPAELAGVDLAVLPKGLSEFHPFSGQRLIPIDHPVLASEATDVQTLAMVEQLRPKKLIFMHIEEPEVLTPPELDRLAHDLAVQRGWDVTFAYDTLVVELMA